MAPRIVVPKDELDTFFGESYIWSATPLSKRLWYYDSDTVEIHLGLPALFNCSCHNCQTVEVFQEKDNELQKSEFGGILYVYFSSRMQEKRIRDPDYFKNNHVQAAFFYGTNEDPAITHCCICPKPIFGRILARERPFEAISKALEMIQKKWSGSIRKVQEFSRMCTEVQRPGSWDDCPLFLEVLYLSTYLSFSGGIEIGLFRYFKISNYTPVSAITEEDFKGEDLTNCSLVQLCGIIRHLYDLVPFELAGYDAEWKQIGNVVEVLYSSLNDDAPTKADFVGAFKIAVFCKLHSLFTEKVNVNLPTSQIPWLDYRGKVLRVLSMFLFRKDLHVFQLNLWFILVATMMEQPNNYPYNLK